MGEKIIKEIYQMKNALEILSQKQRERLSMLMISIGITEEDTVKLNQFIMKSVSTEQFSESLEDIAFSSYIEALKRVKTYMEMAKGYEEMGGINMEISEEMKYLEDEGEMLSNEVVGKESKD